MQFSIVIPLYNKEHSIENTIQSILSQTYNNFELVIVNDGSTDDSLKIVQSIKDKRIRIIDKPNGGVSSARNKGINESRSEWICFLDADDFWHQDYLLEVHKAIKTFPECNIFAVCQKIIFENKAIIYENEFLPSKNSCGYINYYQIISKYNPPIHSSNVTINKHILKKSGLFREGQRNYEDHDLWIRISLYSDIIYINKPLCVHRKDDLNSASKSIFLARDFANYVSTLLYVNNRIDQANFPYFSRFVNRFIPFILIKYYKYYTDQEVREIINISSKLLNLKNKILIKIVVFLKLRKLYSVAKKIKR